MRLMRGQIVVLSLATCDRRCARISPPVSTCQDFPAQMNLVASMLSHNHAGLLDHMKRGT